MEKLILTGCLPQQITEQLGLKQSFRGKQIFKWVSTGVTDFDSMTNLSLEFREELKQKAVLRSSQIEQVLTDPFELPISTTVANNVNRYQRENLLDYAPKKVPALPTDEDENEIVLISNPDKADSSGCTLLMMAARAGNDREVKNLILSGAKVNLKDKEGWNAQLASEPFYR